ncbi:hypothetical protein IWQ60_006770 [Tieghemiomyces parasiticus]|uniref:Uncharacterized protein n=1 Tax=Tieghemiomyces parasiticus TaxID=78921 RepID=A0A9W8A2C7_9FUNG|nr:hypothetical protein IWQ60_006770 [Tieghemiomyces parasiticus]
MPADPPSTLRSSTRTKRGVAADAPATTSTNARPSRRTAAVTASTTSIATDDSELSSSDGASDASGAESDAITSHQGRRSAGRSQTATPTRGNAATTRGTRSSARSANGTDVVTPPAKRVRGASPDTAASSPTRTGTLAHGTPSKSAITLRARSAAREALHTWCRLTFREVRYYKDSTGRLLSKIFQDLPDEEEYPDYYAAIKQPTSLNMVREKIDDRAYSTAAEFCADIERVFTNALFYNEKSSLVYTDAEFLLNLLRKALKKSPPPFEESIEERVAAVEQTGVQVDPPVTKKPKGPTNEGSENGTMTGEKLQGRRLITKSEVEELMAAIEHADYDVAFSILDRVRLDPKALYPTEQDRLKFTWSFLHAAGFFGRFKILASLMEHGIDVNIRDTLYEGTPLAWAAYGDHKRIARALVDRYGADVTATNIHDQVPLDLVAEDEVDDWSQILRKKGDGRDRSKDGTHRAASEAHSAADISSGGRGGDNVVTTARLVPALKEILDLLVNEADPEDEERPIAEMFMELPSAEDYPEYYEVIKEPQAFDLIEKKIGAGHYSTFSAFERDCQLIVENAKFFNERGSQIYDDAEALAKLFKKLKTEVLTKHGLAFLTEKGAIFSQVVPQCVVNQVAYRPHDFILYRRPGDRQVSVAFIRSLTINQSELFLGAATDNMPMASVLGKCLVIPVKDYLNAHPQNIPANRIFLCESRYDEKKRVFQPIRDWKRQLGADYEPTVPLIPRPAPIKLSKVPSPHAAAGAAGPSTPATPQAKVPPGSAVESPATGTSRSGRVTKKVRPSYAEPEEDEEEDAMDGDSDEEASDKTYGGKPGKAQAALTTPTGGPSGQFSSNPMAMNPGAMMSPGVPSNMMFNPMAGNPMAFPGMMPFGPGAMNMGQSGFNPALMRPQASALPLHMQLQLQQFQNQQQMQAMGNPALLQQQMYMQMVQQQQMMQQQMFLQQQQQQQQLKGQTSPVLGANPMAMAGNPMAMMMMGQPQSPNATGFAQMNTATMSNRGSVSGASSVSGSPNPNTATNAGHRRPSANEVAQRSAKAAATTAKKLTTPTGVHPLSPTGSANSVPDTPTTTNMIAELNHALPPQFWQQRTLTDHTPPPTATALIYRLQIATSDRQFFITLDLTDKAYSFHLHETARTVMVKPVSYHAYQRGPASDTGGGATTTDLGPMFYILQQNARPLPPSSYVDGTGKFCKAAEFPLGIPATAITNPGLAPPPPARPQPAKPPGQSPQAPTPGAVPSTPTMTSPPMLPMSPPPLPGTNASTPSSHSDTTTGTATIPTTNGPATLPPALPLQGLPMALTASTPYATPIYETPLQPGLNVLELWISNFPPKDASNIVHTAIAKLPVSNRRSLETAPRYEQKVQLFVTK